jgi:hypothetical protein
VAAFGHAAKIVTVAAKRKTANRKEFRTQKRIAEMTKRAVLKKVGAVD